MKYIPNCKHGRIARLYAYKRPIGWNMGYAAYYWVATRKWFGLKKCCSGPTVESWGDNEDKDYAREAAIKKWRRLCGIEKEPQTEFEKLVDWLESPE